MILRDNAAGHCFVLRDLFEMSFFKLVMIVLLKIYAAGKNPGKICLKNIGDTIFSDMWSMIREGSGTEGNIQQKGKVQTFSLAGGPSFPIPSIRMTS